MNRKCEVEELFREFAGLALCWAGGTLGFCVVRASSSRVYLDFRYPTCARGCRLMLLLLLLLLIAYGRHGSADLLYVDAAYGTASMGDRE